MRDLNPNLEASLQSGCTTLCRCLRLTCADGTVFGFTDHDAVLSVDGATFHPADGFEASEESAALGPRTGEWDLQAALTDDRLSDADLLAGRFDRAMIETLLVDWRTPTVFERLSTGTLGEITSSDGVFQAEVRGPFASFDRVRGRVFSARCDAQLGDTRCGVDLNDPAHRLDVVISAVLDTNRVLIPLSANHTSGHFSGGLCTLPTGQKITIRSHRTDANEAEITLWHAPHIPLAVGDTLLLTAGCDKSFVTCQAVFANADNFRGFPFMPGDDFALSYPASSDGNLDGSSRQT